MIANSDFLKANIVLDRESDFGAGGKPFTESKPIAAVALCLVSDGTGVRESRG
jgi:hypothetical protein